MRTLLRHYRAWRSRKRLTKAIATLEQLQRAGKPVDAEMLQRYGETMIAWGDMIPKPAGKAAVPDDAELADQSHKNAYKPRI